MPIDAACEVHAACVLGLLVGREEGSVPPKRRHISIKVYGVTAQKTVFSKKKKEKSKSIIFVMAVCRLISITVRRIRGCSSLELYDNSALNMMADRNGRTF
jgi:hypothetical protein